MVPVNRKKRNDDEEAILTPHLDAIDEYEGRPQRDVPGPVDWYSPVLLLAVAVLVLIPSLQLGVGTLAAPGPGLWPTLNAILVILAVPLIIYGRHRFDPPKFGELVRVLGIVVPLLLFVPLYNWAGFVGSGAIVLFIIARFVSRLKWISAVVLAVLAPAAVYIAFAVLLGVNLRPF